MKITDIQIEQFGVWRQLALSLENDGLSVFYGPNEAGKSTLMRFIRGVLYGFKPGDASGVDGRRQSIPWDGTLRVEHRGRTCNIRRMSQPQTRGVVRVCDDRNADSPADEFLAEMLLGTNEKVFDQVFAIGLQELQELATLHDEDVAEHIYGLSLGPEGRRLLEVIEKTEARRRQSLNPAQQSGRLDRLFERYCQLSNELAAFEDAREHHVELSEQRCEWEDRIAEFKGRQSGIAMELRGHLYLEQIWEPWRRAQQYRSELDSTPIVAGFPEDGLVRFDEIESELATAVNCQDALITEASQFRKQAEQLELDPEIEKHAATVQSFIDQQDYIRELEERIAQETVQVDAHRQDLEQHIESLGPDWTVSRLQQVDTSPAIHYRMVQQARAYQAALKKKARLGNRLQRMSNTCQAEMSELAEDQKPFGEAGAEQAIAATKTRLAGLEELARLSLREHELEQRRIGMDEQLVRMRGRLRLPKWVYGVLVFFGVFGLMLAGVGVLTGMTDDLVIGAVYAFLGASSGGFLWAFKRSCERDVRDSVKQLQIELEHNAARLAETQTAIQRLHETSLAPSPATAGLSTALFDGNGPSHADLIRETTQRLSDLEQMARRDQRIQALRRRMTGLRARFRTVQRDVSTARQEWCELLVQMGLGETVRVSEAFQTWHRAVEAHEIRRTWQAAADELEGNRRAWDSYRQRIEELGHRMHCWDEDYNCPLDVLAAWEAELKEYSENRKERQRLRREEKARRAESAEYQDRIDELKLRRSVLLVQGGAADREEFERRAAWIERRRELENLLQEANAELESAAQTEPELAIVEDDLTVYDPERNAECIETLQLELDSLDADLEEAFENLGRVKQELRTLEDDRRPVQLRHEREQVAAELQQAAEEWFAVEWAAQQVERIRSNFERTCQPPKLAAAARYLERLSCGKYRNIWTPLGKRRLCVDDDQGHALLVEHLSNGTREQLFLAIRMALLDDFHEQGIELPMVLDDVLVNFDQVRTEAAVDELIEFSRQGHQVLFFTCHLHLAQMFETKGIQPIWLPARESEGRLAG